MHTRKNHQPAADSAKIRWKLREILWKQANSAAQLKILHCTANCGP